MGQFSSIRVIEVFCGQWGQLGSIGVNKRLIGVNYIMGLLGPIFTNLGQL